MKGMLETIAVGGDLCATAWRTKRLRRPETTHELPVGLAVSYAALASSQGRHGPAGNPANYAARRVFSWLSIWIPRYLRCTFSYERRWWSRGEWRQVEEDAVQHGLLAVLIRGTECWRRTTDDHALRWTKAVARNFVITQCVRLRTRRALVESSPLPVVEIDEALQIRESLTSLISLVRIELSSIARPRDLASVLEAYDELITFSFRSMQQHEDLAVPGSDRARHRRLRTRRHVRRVIEGMLAGDGPHDARSELVHFATFIGIEVV